MFYSCINNIIIIGSRNNLFDVDLFYNAETLSITCTFLNQMKVQKVNGKGKFCRVSLGREQGKRCTNLSYTFTNENSEASVLRLSADLSRIATTLMSEFVCLVVTASDGRYTAETESELIVNPGIYVCLSN